MKHSPKGARLGQHFLTRPAIAGWVADAIHLSPTSVVLEIGPGRGVLTRELLQRAGKVVALEKDPALVEELQHMFAEDIQTGKLVLLETDVRDFDPLNHKEVLTEEYSLVANIPYYITGMIIRQFLTAKLQPQHMALLVQKEVAERVVAKDGKESLLSMSVKAYGTPEYVKTVKAGAFSPPPAVDSTILAIRNISRDQFESDDMERRFFEILRAGFSAKRKTLGNNLKGVLAGNSYEICGVSPQARAEDLSFEMWHCLATGEVL
jgi:16S rRNA (adenine1518-N6/adenine1519-N6)-dimethyltransferase